MPPYGYALFLWLFLAGAVLAAPAGDGGAGVALPTFRLGVLAFRPKPETEARWQPLAAYLNRTVAGARFSLEALTYPELEQAVAESRLEFVLTQPSHYVALTHTQSLSSPLATLVEREGGHALDRFGGVIFARAERADLPDLASLRGRVLAISARSSLGGYQMQAFELARAGIRLPEGARLVATGQPQDKVVREVLEGRADAGMVRTGVLEAMQREGKADIKRFRIINPAPPGLFPFHLSTRLYPEWPLAAMPGAQKDVARNVAAALLAMPHDGVTARALRIQGFAIPGDYRPVDELLRELRLPPYDKPAPITPREVWQRWQPIWIGLIAAATLLLSAALLRARARNRELLRLQEEQRRAQAALRESEQHFRNLANGGSALIWTSGLDRQCDYFNEPWLRFTGRTLEQELGNGWAEGVHPEDLPRCLDIYVGDFARRQPFTMEYRLHHADGGYRWIVDEGRPRYDSEGRFVGYIGYCHDITERRQTLEQVRRERDTTRNILETVEAIIVLLDPDGRIERINRKGCEVLGYPPGELLGRNWFDVCLPPGEDKPLLRALFHSILAEDAGDGEYHENQVITRDGEMRLIAWHNRAIRDERGEVIGSLSSGEDITEHRKAEDRLRQAASVFATAREGIMITNAQGDILDVNEAFTWITGYRREEALGRNPGFLSAGVQDKAFYAEFWRALQQEGYWKGEIWNRRKSGEIFVEWLTVSAVLDDAGQTQRYVALFSDITSQKEHQKQLERMAHFDALTGLPNRALLSDRLQLAMVQAKRRGLRLAAALIDLDGFKEINDRHGHKAGDDLLMAVANRMRECVREGDTVARIGGDEFVAVLADLDSDVECLPMIQRLLDAAAAPVRTGELLLQVSGSIGFTFYPQGEEVDADQLLRQADQAMYQAKLAGKNRYHIFDTEHDRAMRGHHESLERIRQGLAADEFTLYYQPKVNMRSGVVVGVEALVRWQHPERGLLPPGAFLPVLEEQPLGMELGQQVLQIALDQIETWKAAGLRLPVSVNISAQHLQEPGFADELLHLLRAHPGVERGDLELEILETSALEDVAQVSRLIHACLELGVEFALDDFGTGYSSLTYLKHLPARQLKIDQSFVHDMLNDPEDLAILEAVLGLVDALRREAIAEGVETLAHGDLLLRLGCELAQGYAIARPMPADAVPAWVASWTPPDSWRRRTPMPHEQRPLLFAAVEHRAWIQGVEAHVAGARKPPQLDHHACRFGRWLDGPGRALFQARPAFPQLEALHEEVHTLAGELMALAAHSPEFQDRLAQLRALRDRLLEQLDALAATAE